MLYVGAAALHWDQCLKENTTCYEGLITPAPSGHMESPCSRAWESPPPGQSAGVEDLLYHQPPQL